MELIHECTDAEQPENWPVDQLDEVALQAIPDGTQVQVTCTNRYEVEALDSGEVNKTFGVRSNTGHCAINGYFRGLQILTYIDRSLPEVEAEVTELTIRLDTLTEQVHLVPIAGLTGLEIDELEPMDVLDYDDILNDIDLLIHNEAIDLAGLSRLFEGIDAEDIRMSLYLKHLNNRLALEQMFDAALSKQIIYLGDEEAVREILDEPQLVEPESGNSFCIIQTESDTGELGSILCINAIRGLDTVKIPVTSVVGLIDK